MCRNGNHSLTVILEDVGAASSKVVRWCSYCGAVVVDEDYDGRTIPGRFAKMRFPAFVKEHDMWKLSMKTSASKGRNH